MTRSGNQPAFPRSAAFSSTGMVKLGAEGMTLRQWYAGLALLVIARHPASSIGQAKLEQLNISASDVIAGLAFEIADAMIALAEKEPKP
jgi:hypothetical protein